MKLQRMFNKVVTHLLSQNEKCLTSWGECAYRNSVGLQCAAGCLIPDKDYKKIFEGKDVRGLLREGLYFTDLSDVEINLLDELQMIHDIEPVKD